MMAQFPGLMLWTDAWVADTAHLSRLERGTYMDLIVLMWRTPGCRVPNDNAWLAKHMRMTADDVVQELRPIIQEFCQNDGNYLFQKRLQKEFVRAAKIQVAQSVRAKSGWNKRKGRRWGNADSAMHPDQNRIESFFGRAREARGGKEAGEEESKEDFTFKMFHAKHGGHP